MRLSATITCLGLMLTLSSAVAAQSRFDTLQNHVTIGGITYDDGFGLGLKDPAGVFYQKNGGEVFVADAGNGRVVIYDSLLSATYTFKHFFKDRQSGKSELGEPRTVAVTSEGEIVLLDARSDRIELLDFRGRVLKSVAPSRLLGDSSLRLVMSAATIDHSDQVYLLVTGAVTRVLILDRDLNLIRQFGEPGDLPHQFSSPSSVGVWQGRIYIGDIRGLPAVKVYDSLGGFLFGFASHDVKPEDISLPISFGFLENPLTGPVILVLDGLRQAVKLYNMEGAFVTTIGGFGYLPGLLQYPSGLSTDGIATFYVVEKGGERVQRYDIR